mgnify:CR=1 FL=1|jgi:chaperonin GroES
MKMKPIGDLVLIQMNEKKEKTKSGIILTDSAQAGYLYGKVISIGTGLYTQTGDKIPMISSEGATIMIHRNQLGDQKKLQLDDTDYYLVHESELAMISK